MVKKASANKTKQDKAFEDEYQKVLKGFRLAAATTLLILIVGSVFYHIVEKFSWLDSIYFSVVTLATVGYGDIVPKTPAGKLFTCFYILIGIGIIASFANLALKRAVLKRQRHLNKKP